jgi:hypothetical protein
MSAMLLDVTPKSHGLTFRNESAPVKIALMPPDRKMHTSAVGSGVAALATPRSDDPARRVPTAAPAPIPIALRKPRREN